MYSLNICICLTVLSTTLAYDFKDPYYNQIIQDEIFDNADIDEHTLASIVNNYRVTRDAEKEKDDDKDKKCRGRWHRSCCGDEHFKNHEKFRELKRECFAEVRAAGVGKQKRSADDMPPPAPDMFSCEKINKTKAEYVCVTQCVGQKQKVLDEEGNLLVDAVEEFVNSEIATSDWQKEVAPAILEKCIEEANAEGLKPREEGACNPSGMKFGHCMWKEFQLACPKELIKDTKQCQKLREKLNKKEPTPLVEVPAEE